MADRKKGKQGGKQVGPAAARDEDRQKARKAALGAINRYFDKLLLVGGVYADTLNSQGKIALDYVNDVLGESTGPKDWFKDGVAAVVNTCQKQVERYHKVYGAIWSHAETSQGSRPPEGPHVPGGVAFSLDDYSEAGGPIPTGIPAGQLDTVKIAPLVGQGPAQAIQVTGDLLRLSTINDQVCVSLPKVKAARLQVGDYRGQLSWGPLSEQKTLGVLVRLAARAVAKK